MEDKPKQLVLRYDVTNSFHSLLAVLVSGRIMFENICDLDEFIPVPRNMNRKLFRSLSDKISELHESDEIVLLEVEVAMFYVSLVITRIFFLNKTYAEYVQVLPMLSSKNEKEYKHLVSSYIKFSNNMLWFITHQFEDRDVFKQALHLLGNWSLKRKLKVQ
jgi:hypothetical protein